MLVFLPSWLDQESDIFHKEVGLEKTEKQGYPNV